MSRNGPLQAFGQGPEAVATGALPSSGAAAASLRHLVSWWGLAGVLLLVAPIVLLFWLLGHPRQNAELLIPVQHVVVVTNVSLLALTVAALLARSAIHGRQQTGVLLLPLGFVSMAGLFAVHAIATPGVIVHGHAEDYGGTATGVSAYLSLFVPALFFAARYLPLSGRVSPRLGLRPGILLFLVSGALLAYAGLAIWRSSLIGSLPISGPPASYGLAAGTILLLGFSAWRQNRAFRVTRLPMQGALVLVFLLLAEAQVSMVIAPMWTIAWWEYHLLMLGAVVLALWALFVELDRRQDLERFLAAPVVDRVLAGDTFRLGGERRVATILFADLRGFTAFSERLAPEEVAQLLTEFFTAMTEEIFREDGMVDKYLGDGVMAVFGVPGEQPDHPERAVRAALAMQRRMQELQVRRQTEGRESVGMGIGIATGHAVVGSTGAPSRMEYTAIGSTVNIASRLSDLAGDGEILTTWKTYWRVQQLVDGSPRGPTTVKGLSRSVEIVELKSVRTSPRSPEVAVSPRWGELVARVQRDAAYRSLWQERPAEATASLDLDEAELALATRAALVARCPAFVRVPAEELATLATKGSIDEFEAGTIVVRQGAEEDSFYFILEGEVAITVADQVGHRHVLASLKPGDYFGEVAFLFDTTRIADAQAVTPCTLLSLQRDDFYRVLEAAPTVRREVEATAMRRLRQPFPGPTAVNGLPAVGTS